MNKFHIDIKSGESFYTAIYERKYILTIDEVLSKVIIKLTFQDYTPSGYADGGENCRGTLLLPKPLTKTEQNQLTSNITKFIATLALKHDSQLNHVTGCARRNKSQQVIKDKLSKLIG